MKKLYFLVASLLTIISPILSQSENTCNNFQIEIRNPRNGHCDTSTGIVDIVITGGTSDFFIEWRGESSDEIKIEGRWFTIRALPIGDYAVSVTDENGCQQTAHFSIDAAMPCDAAASSCEDFTAQIVFQDGSCADDGSIVVEVENGVPPYKLRRRDLIDYNISTLSLIQSSSFQWDGVPPSSYEVTLTDKNGCIKQTTGDIKNDDFLSKVEIVQQPSCEGKSDGKISVEIIDGFADSLTVAISGATNRQEVFYESKIELDSLPSGRFEIIIDNHEGCRRTIRKSLSPFYFRLIPRERTNCGQQLGTLFLAIYNTTNEEYNVKWTGTTSDELSTTKFTYIQSLPFGEYTFQVSNNRGCTLEQTIDFRGHIDCEDIQAACDSFHIAIQNPRNEVCFAEEGMADLIITNGTPGFIIDWEGESSGTMAIEGRQFTLKQLAVGDYTVTVTDGNDCQKTAQFSIDAATGCTTEELGCDVLEIQTLIEDVNCVNDGRLEISVQNGQPPYVFIWKNTFLPEGARTSVKTDQPFFELNNLEEGDYYISVLDDNRCEARTVGNIRNQNFDTRTTIIQQPACDSIADGIIQLEIREGFSDSLLVELNGPINTQQFLDSNIIQFDSLLAGQYTISLTNQEGCQRVIKRELQPFSFKTRLISWTNCGQRLGRVNLILSNAIDETSTYTIRWFGPTEGELPPSQYQAVLIDSLIFGEYTFQIINNRGCVVEQTFDFAERENCSTCTDFSVRSHFDLLTVHFSAIGGTPPYQVNYFMSDEDTVSIEAQSCEFDITFPEAGAYSVSIIDANGCEWARRVFVLDREVEGCIDVRLGIPLDSSICIAEPFDLPIIITGGSGYYEVVVEGIAGGFFTVPDSVFVYEDFFPSDAPFYYTSIIDLVTDCRYSYQIPTFPECACPNVSFTVEQEVPYIDRDNKGSVTLLFMGLPSSTIDVTLYPRRIAPPARTVQLDEFGKATVTFDDLFDISYGMQIVTADQCHALHYIEVPQNCEPQQAEREVHPITSPPRISDQSQRSDIFSIYPNPATHTIRLNSKIISSEAINTRIYNLNGQLVKTKQWQLGTDQEILNLPNGIYFIQIQSDDTVQRLPFIISR